MSRVRPATPDDAPGILAIYAPIIEETAVSFELVAPTLDDVRRRIGKAHEAHDFLVSVDEGGVVEGYVYGSQHRERAAYQWAVDVTVYIRADARGRGVGRRLYETLLPRLAARGYYQAFAGIALPNDASVGLHEAVGFTHLGTYRNVGFKLGAWRDVGWWQKQLRAPVPDEIPAPPGR